MHLYRMSEWQGGGGNWYCNDVSDLTGVSAQWWVPARILDMEPAEFIKWLVETYKPQKISWNGKTFLYSWDKTHYSDMHKFLLYINSQARKKNFIC